MKGGGRENVEERWRKVDEKWWRRSGAKVREGENMVLACQPLIPQGGVRAYLGA